MRLVAAAEVVPLDHALEAMSLAGADHVDALALVEDRHQDLRAGRRRLRSLGDPHFPAHPCRRNVGLLEMAGSRLVRLVLAVDEPDLHGLVAVGLGRLALDHHARTGLEHGRRFERPVPEEQLGHPDFLADDSCDHTVPPTSRVPCRTP